MKRSGTAKRKPVGRTREARRWLDELSARSTNSKYGQSMAEGRRVWHEGLADLRARDPELSAIVDRLKGQDLARRLRVTFEESKEMGYRSAVRIRKVRDELRRAGKL